LHLFVLAQLITHRRTAWLLAMRNVRDRYTGTLAGAVWMVLHPLLLLSVFWVVFSQGFKMTAVGGKPFMLALFCALVPWMTVAESIGGAVQAVTGRAYLIKKIAFPSEILPFTHVLAALATHTILLVILALICASYGYVPGAGLLLLPYYVLALSVLVGGIAMLVAALNVYCRDVSQAVAVLLNIWFWATPIVWPADMLPPSFAPLLDWNPMTYIAGGYRDIFLSPELLLPSSERTLYFWVFALVCWTVGTLVFRRLKSGFADVL